MAPQDGKSFVEYIFEYLLDSWDRESLLLLLQDDGAWKEFTADIELSREEEETLRDALIEELAANATVKDPDGHQDTLQEREMFLNAYPQVKLELEERIGKLHALADKVDKVHRDCTITNVVADSTSAASGVLVILGLALAPVTAGVSLMLSATGAGLGAAAAVTRITSGIVDHTSKSSAEAEASRLALTSKDTVTEAVGQIAPKVLSNAIRPLQCLKGIEKNVRAIQVAKANPALIAHAKRLMTTGRISARNTKQVGKAFGGTALAMTKGARIAGAVAAGAFLLLDVVSLVQESTRLHQGAKTESAAELRKQAEKLEGMLRELIQIHDILQSA